MTTISTGTDSAFLVHVTCCWFCFFHILLRQNNNIGQVVLFAQPKQVFNEFYVKAKSTFPVLFRQHPASVRMIDRLKNCSLTNAIDSVHKEKRRQEFPLVGLIDPDQLNLIFTLAVAIVNLRLPRAKFGKHGR